MLVSKDREIVCDLWRLGLVVMQGAMPVATCRYYEIAKGHCTHKDGPLICVTDGLKNTVVR